MTWTRQFVSFVETGAGHESKVSSKIRRSRTKATQAVFILSRCLFPTHNSFKTTCSCILSLSVTDVMRGSEFEVKCRWHIPPPQTPTRVCEVLPPPPTPNPANLCLIPQYHTSPGRKNVSDPTYGAGSLKKAKKTC